jgi:hypothetical protein
MTMRELLQASTPSPSTPLRLPRTRENKRHVSAIGWFVFLFPFIFGWLVYPQFIVLMFLPLILLIFCSFPLLLFVIIHNCTQEMKRSNSISKSTPAASSPKWTTSRSLFGLNKSPDHDSDSGKLNSLTSST